MVAVLAFGTVLLLAVLVSDLAHRSVLSTAVLFLVAGFVLGPGMAGVIALSPDHPAVTIFAELALFTVLFTDGMRTSIRDLAAAWSLPGRALLFGMPLTLLCTAAAAHWVVSIPWSESLLMGAVLSPTDPVFAAAIVGREEVPERLRRLLNVESGLNDGLALPLVVGLIAYAGHGEFHPLTVLGEVALGVAIGVAIPWIGFLLERTSLFSTHVEYEPLYALSIGLIVFAIAILTHANEYLAAFSAGISVASLEPRLSESFHHFGELLGELLKLSALMVFGSLLSPLFLNEISASGYLFAILALFFARPFALGVALIRSELNWHERLVAAWFGPKGFASVLLGLLVLQAGLERSNQLFHLIAIVIVGSILAHSSTDVVVARWFREDEAGVPAAAVKCG